MKRGWGMISLGVMIGVLTGSAAPAGPWTQSPGETFTVTSLRFMTTELTEPRVAAFRQPTANFYAEHGWREAITIGAEAEANLGIPAKGSAKPGGLVRSFARARLWQGKKGEIISVEGSFGVVAEQGKTPFVEPRVSFLYGEGYESGWYDIAASVRFRGRTVDELHSDATYGYRPAPGWVTYVQATTIQRLDPRIGEDLITTRFGLFVGYDIAPGQTLVIGARREFFGTFAPPALEGSVSLWMRF